ncbi:MAG TPA: exodeoxyribonuclease VII small subunit [Firmicutes bacterium]|nr:exodeoxyribonuclease VII small subunit [Bacillota bacterium]
MSQEELGNLGFEQALARLEQVVRTLEQGELGLDESLRLFETGTRLLDICHRRLDEAEGRITRLVRDEDGQDAEVPWEPGPPAN